MSSLDGGAVEHHALRHADRALAGICALLPHLAGVVALVFVQADRRIDTACVFASGRILIHPNWFLALSANEAIFVLAHEVMHLTLQSHERMVGANAELFNVAHDLIINDLLCKELGCPVPADGLYVENASQLSAERIVSDLRLQLKQGQCILQSGWGACRSAGGSTGSAMLDALRQSGLLTQTEAPPPAEKSSGRSRRGDVLQEEWERQWFPDEDPRSVADWREEVRIAARTAVDLGILRDFMEQAERKQRGEDAGDAHALVIAMQAQQAPPWQQAMQQWIEAMMPGPRTYTRPSRRGADRTDLVLPGRKREGWTLHLVLDTSGSMTDSLPMILGAIAAFCQEMNIGEIHILQCDVEVTSDLYLPPEELANFPVAGFGGSDMTPAMMRLAQDPDVEVVIVLTDGWIAYPATPMPYEVLWVLDYENGFDPPYGQVMPLTRYQQE